jgi:hypothetical protein
MIMNETHSKTISDRRRGERGAALWTVMAVSMLLLIAGSALILTTSMSASSSVDSVAETQAYYAAEAGLQQSLNVLRGNVATPTFTFSTAADCGSGNKVGDSTTYSRLSNWLTYSTTYTDRVTLTTNYTPLTGLAYSVAVYNPDPETMALPGAPPAKDDFHPPPGATPAATPTWHQWHCGHCSYDYSHHPYCNHKHCTSPQASGRATVDDSRLLVQATGYGPKGAVKKIEMMVKHTMLDYDNAAATVLMVGNNTSPMTLKITQDHDNAYSGKDLFGGSTTLIDAVGFTASNDKTAGDAYVATLHNAGKPLQNAADGTRTILLDSSNTPSWLATADDARDLLAEMQVAAMAGGRYFTTANPPLAGNYGDDGHSWFTFIDGDFTVPDGKKGGGLLVVTGTLTFAGSAGWDGFILCMGNSPAGTSANFKVTLNKNAFLHGALIIAPFDRYGPTGSPFLAPVFDNSLGGDTLFQYDSSEVRDAIYTLPPHVVGVHEGWTVAPS